MQITRQADYAMRAVLYLARLTENERAATSVMAREQRIPPSFLAKIISQLSIARLVHTTRGVGGGVTLAHDPKDITLLAVIEAVEGPITLNICVSNQNSCAFEDDCPLQTIWCDAQNELVTRLRNTNFAQLIAQEHVTI